MTILEQLLSPHIGLHETRRLTRLMHIPAALSDTRVTGAEESVPRVHIAFALNMWLFRDLLQRVPEGRAYTEDALKNGRTVFFDHGAVRTVLAEGSGALPAGESALTRVLKPLGYKLNETYPLPRLRMTGRAYLHNDLPEVIPQFFVSELHVDQFSPVFQQTAVRVIGTSVDPLSEADKAHLAKLEETRALALADAVVLLPALFRCFDRQHDIPSLHDYETLRAESQEMAWIATEGNAFNHVTDRVPDLFALTEEQRLLGRSIKTTVEVAARGTLRQTAYRAAEVERVFRTDQGCIVKRVPGSFYEFITRDRVDAGNPNSPLDLGFDSSNATAIFKMTSVDAAVC
jgi:PAS domain-containing protein